MDTYATAMAAPINTWSQSWFCNSSISFFFDNYIGWKPMVEVKTIKTVICCTMKQCSENLHLLLFTHLFIEGRSGKKLNTKMRTVWFSCYSDFNTHSQQPLSVKNQKAKNWLRLNGMVTTNQRYALCPQFMTLTYLHWIPRTVWQSVSLALMLGAILSAQHNSWDKYNFEKASYMKDSLQRRCGGSDIKREWGLERDKNSVEASRAKLMVTMKSVKQLLNTILSKTANHQQFFHHFPSCIISPQKNYGEVCLLRVLIGIQHLLPRYDRKPRTWTEKKNECGQSLWN